MLQIKSKLRTQFLKNTFVKCHAQFQAIQRMIIFYYHVFYVKL